MKIKKKKPFLIVSISLALSLNACTNIKNEPYQKNDLSVNYINIQQHINSANEHFKSRNYNQSLMHWKILRSIQPNNTQYENRIRVLNALINRRIKKHQTTVDLALKNKDISTAKSELFIILTLKPNHQTAIAKLKVIEENEEIKRQARKTKKYLLKRQQAHENNVANKQPSTLKPSTFKLNKKDNAQALFYLELGLELFDNKDWRGSIREINKYLTTNPTDTKAKEILITSHINLSKIFEDRGHLEPAIQHMEDAVSLKNPVKKRHKEKLKKLRHKLSASYYIEGVKVYRDNIDQAIIYWKRAAATNPGNIKAKIRLKKAKKLKEKLERIKSK